MKTNLITTKDYLLLIDEEAEIKPDDYIIHDTIEGIVEANDEWDYRGEKDNYWNKVIAFYPLTKEAKELEGLPLLPSFEEVDIEKLAKLNFPNSPFGESIENIRERNGFIEGYKAAQSKTSFTLEDVRKAIKMARTGYGYDGNIDIEAHLDMGGIDNYNNEFKLKTEEEIIQSLSTQQLPKEFILGGRGTIEEQIKNGYYIW